ncbi:MULTISPECIES: hypothetical protein [unclassified Streptomyces]|uniref:hypothetical protein n=1 Tax=unclassified Streptomyces TaxID=2593676 RepID=UPI0001C1BF98|nr:MULTISPECIES: hypothetical protein [unclassified Streptomyces]AEN08069.1 hypothetical protein SACTE_0114 [Streptomyces sp. SirexAA-E]MYR68426.1 hypothetical protein [Streptomyces sp. SID4939]MYS02130.1 hypothetical protein [Streptomyces sp. SID4940]MYT66781.1 hypothetical protein [Streptomyces sp. SID8357]MYT83702.1 hypothetical protein [Streptomyces sp. SID8360]
MTNSSVTSSHDPRADASAVAEGLRITGRDRRPVFGSAFLVGATALLVGGGAVAGGFAAAWGLFLQARRSAESSIDYEESYAAYIDQWDGLVRVAMWVYALLFLVAIVSVAWLLTAQAVTVRHARERTDTASPTLTLRTLWRRSRPHFGAALRIQVLTLGSALVPGAAGLLVLAAVDREMVPGVVWPTYHEPATLQFILVGRILPAVIWAFGLVLLSRLSLATAVRVADDSSATAAIRRSWTLTRTARLRTTGVFLLCSAAITIVFIVLKWLGTYVAHWAGLLMLATTDDNVWVTGVLVIITPVAVALVLLPLVLAPVGVVLACLRERLDDGVGRAGAPSGRRPGVAASG